MRLTIFFIFGLIVGAFIQAIRLLSPEWTWLGSMTSKIPHFKVITIVLSILCVLSGAIYQAITEFNKKQYSVFVVPESLDVSPGYNKRFIMKIVNNQDFPIYQIDLRIAVERGDLSVNDIRLNSTVESKIKSEMKSETGKVTISHDVIGLGMTTKDGKRENHLILYDIDAHATREFSVDINANNMQQHSKAVFQIARTDRNPTDITKFDPFRSCRKR